MEFLFPQNFEPSPLRQKVITLDLFLLIALASLKMLLSFWQTRHSHLLGLSTSKLLIILLPMNTHLFHMIKAENTSENQCVLSL